MEINPSVEKVNHESLLWNDLYKFTMMWAVLKLFPTIKVKYTFYDRNNIVYPDGFDVELRKVIETYRNRSMSPKRKKEFADKCSFLPQAFFDFLDGYKFDPTEVGVTQDAEGHLHITISGYWYRTILWEVPLMASICDLYYKMTGQVVDVNSYEILNSHRVKATEFNMRNIRYVDFGTRRAYSPKNHENVVRTFCTTFGGNFIGTSNIELGCAFGTKIIGTYAHEFVSAHGAMFGYSHANKHAMDSWVKVYNGNLGIALPDTFTTDAFFVDFDSLYANLFTGIRHDSGDPLEFIDNVIEHYQRLGIDPTTKTLVFSDGLNMDEVIRIDAHRHNEIKRTYGIGTWLTNNIPGIKPLNIVIKLTEVDGLPAIKLSDNPAKSIGDKETIKFATWQVKQQIKAYKKHIKK